MQKYSKISLLIFSVLAIGIPLYVIISICITDPLQIWHKSFFDKNTYSYTIRESARAFIRDYDFDSVILGNSHTENTSAKKSSEMLGGKFINLSMSGSSFKEKYDLLQYLLKKKKIKQVVFLMDTQYIKFIDMDTNNYDYLYDDYLYNDIKIYLNKKYFLCALGLQKKSKCNILENLNIDQPYSWENSENHYKRFGGFNNWLENYDNEQIAYDFTSLLNTPADLSKDDPDKEYLIKLEKILNENLLNVIKDNPDIKFYIIISPISNLGLAQSIRDENLSFKKSSFLMELLTDFQSKHNNMKIYAFDNLAEIGNIEDFKDLTHYRSWVNYFILKSMAEGKNQITENNRKEYLNAVYEKALNVNYDYYINKIKQVVNK